jgi:hypothetical protein
MQNVLQKSQEPSIDFVHVRRVNMVFLKVKRKYLQESKDSLPLSPTSKSRLLAAEKVRRLIKTLFMTYSRNKTQPVNEAIPIGHKS